MTRSHRLRRRPGLRWALLAALLALAARAAAGGPFPANGIVAGQEVATTVDSAIAAYYLQSTLGGGEPDNPLHRAIDQALADAPDPTDREALRRLAERFSTDFATLYFVSALDRVEKNRRAAQRYRSLLAVLESKGAPQELAAAHSGTVFVFVPGYGYRKNPDTGADFARQRQTMEQMGFETVLAETDETGTVEGNARIVGATLERLAKEREAIVVVSTSKGGPEAALALGGGLSEMAARRITAWISVGGLLRGSPTADRALRPGLPGLLARGALLVRGLPREMVASLGTARRRAAFDALSFPPGLLTLQFVGAPLSGQVSSDVEKRYRRMSRFGPNDGLTLLADELVPGGLAIPELGLDHYYRDPQIDKKGLALVLLVLERMGGDRGGRAEGRGRGPMSFGRGS